MYYYTKRPIAQFLLLFIVFSVSFSSLRASHIVGGEMTYRYIGDSTVSYNPRITWPRYEVTLVIYQDCTNGQPEAMAQDNPAFLAVYNSAAPYAFIRADSVHYATSEPIKGIYNSPCGSASTNYCLLKKTFKIRYALNPAFSHVISYSRCCRNAQVSNLVNSATLGSTYYCTIPSTKNNSAVFKEFPPISLAMNASLTTDLSATDADGDSLTYELCSAKNGASAVDIKPFPPDAPPFNNIPYTPGITAGNPMYCLAPMQLNPTTGILNCTPNQSGLYLITECCHEWRNGVLINTISREFQFKVSPSTSDTYKPDAGKDVSILVGGTYQFEASGAETYSWSPTNFLSDPNIPNPIGHFTTEGVFGYTVHGISDKGCEGDDFIRIIVTGHSGYAVPNAFTPNGDGKNDYLGPYPVGNSTLLRFEIFNRWGNRVYSSDVAIPGWDGKYYNIRQDMGVYFWQVEFLDNNGQKRITKGNVTLIR